MTNKPMLSVELELIERVTSQTLGMSAKKDRAYAAHELRALLNAQHAVCSNGILCQNSKCAECGGNGAYKPSKVTGEDVLRWMDEHAAVQRQGEPVACLTRSRNILTQASIAVDGKDHFSAWSEWAPNSIEYGRAVTDPIRNNPVCYEIELLFKEQPAPVADQAQCEECKGWGYHENHHDGGGTECGECGGSGNATVAVVMVMVMPDRMEVEPFTTVDRGSKNYKAGYNAALAEVARLNEVKP